MFMWMLSQIYSHGFLSFNEIVLRFVLWSLHELHNAINIVPNQETNM